MTLATSFEIACDPSAVSEARRWLVSALEPHASAPAAGAVLDDASLCVSELVTNALRAQCTSLAVSVELSTASLRLCVFDDAEGLPTLQRPDQTDPHGRGLLIVDALAAQWGTQPTATGKEVWVELAWPHARPGEVG